MILCAKSFSRTDPGRKPRDLIGYYSPHLDANKMIQNSFEIPYQHDARSFIKQSRNSITTKIDYETSM